jgi:hypothetical protein
MLTSSELCGDYRMSRVQAIQWLCDNPTVESSVNEKGADDRAESMDSVAGDDGGTAAVADDTLESAESDEVGTSLQL